MKPEDWKRPVRIRLPNNESLTLVYDLKVLVKDVFNQVCTFCLIEEHKFFGLSILNEKETLFLDLNQRLSKYAPKEWSKLERRKSNKRKSLKLLTALELDFQVQFFVEHPRLIRDQAARRNYYLHIKKNFLKSTQRVNDELIFTLAAASLHIECGDYDQKLHVGSYFDPNEHVPHWFIQKWQESYIISNLPAIHRELVNTTEYAAQGDYIKEALGVDDVSVHTYKLFKNKHEKNASVLMGIHHNGVRFTHTHPESKLELNFEWNRIGRLSFNKKRFELFPSEVHRCHRLTYYTGSNSRSQYFLRFMKDAHSINMSLTPYMEQIRSTLARQARPNFRISYIYGVDPNGTERESRIEKLQQSGILVKKHNNSSTHLDNTSKSENQTSKTDVRRDSDIVSSSSYLQSESRDSEEPLTGTYLINQTSTGPMSTTISSISSVGDVFVDDESLTNRLADLSINHSAIEAGSFVREQEGGERLRLSPSSSADQIKDYNSESTNNQITTRPISVSSSFNSDSLRLKASSLPLKTASIKGNFHCHSTTEKDSAPGFSEPKVEIQNGDDLPEDSIEDDLCSKVRSFSFNISPIHEDDLKKELPDTPDLPTSDKRKTSFGGVLAAIQSIDDLREEVPLVIRRKKSTNSVEIRKNSASSEVASNSSTGLTERSRKSSEDHSIQVSSSASQKSSLKKSRRKSKSSKDRRSVILENMPEIMV